MKKTVIVEGIMFEIMPSTRKNKQLMAVSKDFTVHFGDPNMKEYPGTKRGDNYCARSYGIKGKDDIRSANFWSRRYLWNCKGKKSLKRKTLNG